MKKQTHACFIFTNLLYHIYRIYFLLLYRSDFQLLLLCGKRSFVIGFVCAPMAVCYSKRGFVCLICLHLSIVFCVSPFS